MYLRNAWYVAAWDTEITDTPFARTIMDERIVIYRRQDGTPVALEDRCCHRNLPLSMGKVVGDNLRCGYHGLVFGPDGSVVHIPGQTTIPPGARVGAYPVVERWNFLWIWMGDPDRADPDLIPDWIYMDHPDWIIAPGNERKPLPVACNYEFNNDNVLDLTHVAVVHESRLGGASIGEFPVKTERSERSVRMVRHLYDVAPMPLFAPYVDAPDGKVDRWQIAEIEVPCHCLVDAGIVPPGRGEPGADRTDGVDFRAMISATPETETTMHLFYAQARNFAHDDEELAQVWVREFRDLFLEDVAVMEAQQEVYARVPDAHLIDINSDAPHLAMRRLLAEHIARERSRDAGAA